MLARSCLLEFVVLSCLPLQQCWQTTLVVVVATAAVVVVVMVVVCGVGGGSTIATTPSPPTPPHHATQDTLTTAIKGLHGCVRPGGQAAGRQLGTESGPQGVQAFCK